MEAAIIGFIDIKCKNALKLIFTNMNTGDISTYKGIFVIQYAESHIFVITAERKQCLLAVFISRIYSQFPLKF